jgi:hypothetical protein
MMNFDKTLASMKTNPQGWRIEDVQRMADQENIKWRQGKGSHCLFDFGETILSIPAKRPIKPIYIKQFVKLLETRG